MGIEVQLPYFKSLFISTVVIRAASTKLPTSKVLGLGIRSSPDFVKLTVASEVVAPNHTVRVVSQRAVSKSWSNLFDMSMECASKLLVITSLACRGDDSVKI
ncbi:hypothetical protein CCR75_007209 [Bremia lactucae]|uniref:Uncharacterized protein n=1 Tax=Bremia lactucae TaxID=4779 RepID=A0A976FJA3_BRELC|nr:hypothetical protein CCR75_007209 [Bremia lactucae]